MEEKRKKEPFWESWALIIILFMVGLGPFALVLLLVKLFGRDRPVKTPDQVLPEKRTKLTVGRMTRSPAVKKSNAKALRIVGGVVAVLGIIPCAEAIDRMLWLGEIGMYQVEDLITGLTITAAGCAMFISGRSMGRAMQRYGKYLAVLGDRETAPLEEFSRTLGYSPRQVERDLQKMIDKGYFGGRAYLHLGAGRFFRSERATESWKKEEEQKRPPIARQEGAYGPILEKIRQANRRIADPELSGQIDRLEQIAARIFQAVEADPAKRDQIGTFLNYYLPTTQKLLDSYAEFERAGVEGENLRQAKQRIKSTMAQVIEGFEHQLDALYRADALDVDSDIRVLETMLRRDTASVEKDFGQADTP